MKIGHIGIWVNDLREMQSFYMKYFGMNCGEPYRNEKRSFSSCFLFFASGAKLELMNIPGLITGDSKGKPTSGLAHIALSCGSKGRVDELTEWLRKDGFTIAGEPRVTGDGYYESVVLDPEGNIIELTA